MKLAITIQTNDAFKSITELTLLRLQLYCSLHKYSLFVNECDLKSPEIVWQRIPDIQKVLADHDVAIHLDADILITNPDIRMEDILRDDGTDCWFGTDTYGINDGFCTFRNTESSQHLLCWLADSVNRGYSSPQDAMGTFLHTPELRVDCNITLLPQHMVNSYMTEEYGELDPAGQWKEGDFILHLPAMSNDRRVEILKKFV